MLRTGARRLGWRHFRRASGGAAAPPEAAPLPPDVAVAAALEAASAEVAALRQRLRLAPDAPLRLALGLSGGVDSALCGALLARLPGVHLTPVFMKNWDEAEESDAGSSCNFAAERASAVQVAAYLGLPLQEVDFVREYWHSVFQPFLASAAAGCTPNPDHQVWGTPPKGPVSHRHRRARPGNGPLRPPAQRARFICISATQRGAAGEGH